MRRLLLPLAALLVALATTPAAAQLPTLPMPPAPPSSTQRLAGHLARQLMADAPPPVRGARFSVAVTIEGPGGKKGERLPLAEFLEDSTAVALRGLAAWGPRVDPNEPAEERIELTVSSSGGHLHATARRRTLPRDFWERATEPDGRVLATAFAQEPLDVELRSLMGLPPRTVQWRRMRPRSVGRRSERSVAGDAVLDMLVADLGADRRPELVALQRERLLVLRWNGRGFGLVAEHKLTDLPANPARLRSPLGRVVAVVRGDGTLALVVATSDHARPEVLAWQNDSLVPVTGAVPSGWPLYAAEAETLVTAPWPSGVDVLMGAARRERLTTEAPPDAYVLPPVYDVRAAGVRTDGAPPWKGHVLAALQGGAVGVAFDAGTAELKRHGLAVAVGDLDLDGDAEVYTTSAALGTARDTITAYELRAGAEPAVLARWSVRAAVTALAVGDVDRDGYDEVLVAEWNGRRADLGVLAPVVR